MKKMIVAVTLVVVSFSSYAYIKCAPSPMGGHAVGTPTQTVLLNLSVASMEYAFKLADALRNSNHCWYNLEAAAMIIKQAERIAELEKEHGDAREKSKRQS